MSLEDDLHALAKHPKPRLSPFFAARVTAHVGRASARLAPRIASAYWIALTVIGGPLLLTSWQRFAVVAGVVMLLRLAAALTPEGTSPR